jgi:hypothetical protein
METVDPLEMVAPKIWPRDIGLQLHHPLGAED